MPKCADIHSVLVMEGCLDRMSQGRVAPELSCKKPGLQIGKSNQPGRL